MLDSVVGKSLGKYQNLELIGRGAMAEVYKAYHPALDRFIALKLLHSFLAEDKNFLERFRRLRSRWPKCPGPSPNWFPWRDL